jgi:hypothetical protein
VWECGCRSLGFDVGAGQAGDWVPSGRFVGWPRMRELEGW